MNVTVSLPDRLATRFGEGAELERRVLETLVADEYRAGRMDLVELGEILSLSQDAAEQFLRARGLMPEPATVPTADEMRAREAAAADLVERFRAFRAGKTLGGLDVKSMIEEGRR